MIKQEYKLSEVVDELTKTYYLPIDSYAKANLRKKIIDVCKKTVIRVDNTTTFLDTCVDKRKDDSKKPSYIFNAHQKKILCKSSDLRKYLLKHTQETEKVNEMFREELANEEEARIANRHEEEILGKIDWETYYQEIEDSKTYGISEQELRQKKIEIMVEALFLEYYEPIDEQLLKNDMELDRFTEYMHNTGESVGAKKRLSNTMSYCIRKK